MKTHAEDIEQIKIVHWVRSHTDFLIYANVNQGKRAPMYGAILKRMGLLAGVPDLFISEPTKHYHGAYIEVKVGFGKVSEAQADFMFRATQKGYFATAVWGGEAGIAVIKELYNLK